LYPYKTSTPFLVYGSDTPYQLYQVPPCLPLTFPLLSSFRDIFAYNMVEFSFLVRVESPSFSCSCPFQTPCLVTCFILFLPLISSSPVETILAIFSPPQFFPPSEAVSPPPLPWNLSSVRLTPCMSSRCPLFTLSSSRPVFSPAFSLFPPRFFFFSLCVCNPKVACLIFPYCTWICPSKS